MDQQFGWFVGLDWASTLHRVCVLNDEGERVAERDVDHSGAALADMCAWLSQVTGAAPEEIAVAIETPRGARWSRRCWNTALRCLPSIPSRSTAFAIASVS